MRIWIPLILRGNKYNLRENKYTKYSNLRRKFFHNILQYLEKYYMIIWGTGKQREQNSEQTLHKKWTFPYRISGINMTNSAVSCGFGHIY